MDTFHLPIWAEYIKALGTPVVALTAAVIAGGIAFLQWITARNKLKLDFFDRRMTIYNSAIQVIDWNTSPDLEHSLCISELRNHALTARWLMSSDVENYLNSLLRKANKAYHDADPRTYPIPTRNPKEDVLEKAKRKRVEQMDELNNLDKIFMPYLSVKH